MDTDVGPPGRATAREMMLSGMLHGALLDAAGWAGVNQILRDQRDEARRKLEIAEQEINSLKFTLKQQQEEINVDCDERDDADIKLLAAEQEIRELHHALTSCREHADAAWHERDQAVQKLEDATEPKCEHGVSHFLCSNHRNEEEWLRSHIRAIGYGHLLGPSEQGGA